MRKINEIMRLKFEVGLSLSKIAQSCNVSKSTVSDILKRFDQSGLSWPLPEGMEETDLEERLYPTTPVKKDEKPFPDLTYIHQELKRKHVTLRLLWEEYKQTYPNGYQYSYFCEIYHTWRQKLDVSLRQPYPYGKYMEVDFAGTNLPSSHQKHLEWSPSRILKWAEKSGQYTARMVQELMDESVHVEQSYRRCLGLLRLSTKYGVERLNNACQRALHFRAISFKSVKSILEKGLDKQPIEEKTEQSPLWHQNVRGPSIADAILDRLIHSSHKLNLKGESMRKKENN